MSSTAAPTGSNGAATNTIPVTGFGGGGAEETGSSDSGSSDQGGAGSIFMPNAGRASLCLQSSSYFSCIAFSGIKTPVLFDCSIPTLGHSALFMTAWQGFVLLSIAWGLWRICDGDGVLDH
jgi:hypothetical protein